MSERWISHHAEVLDALSRIESDSVDGILSDFPYGLGDKQPTLEEIRRYLDGEQFDTGGDFMGADWHVPSVPTWREMFRVLKPGGFLLGFGAPRTIDLISLGARAAGFAIRDVIAFAWMFGCLSEDTEILVDGEWRRRDNVRVGQHALAYDPTNESFSWLPIEETVAYQENEFAFRIHSDGTDQLLSRNHRCVVIDDDGHNVFRAVEDVARERKARLPILEDLRGLLEAVPLPEPHPGSPQQDVREEVSGGPSAPCSRTGAQADEVAADPSPGAHHVLRMRGAGLAQYEACRTREVAEVLRTVQWSGARADLDPACASRSGGLDRSLPGLVQVEDERREEPSLEGRCHDLQEARELHGGEVRALPAGAPHNGEEGRLRHGAPTGGRADDRSSASSSGSRTPRESHPVGQPAGEPGSLLNESRPQAVRGARFTRADLARVEAVPYSGVVWCIKVATGAFVARRNGKAFITGNSGFPKSQDTSKAIDDAAGAERDVVGVKAGHQDFADRSTSSHVQSDDELGAHRFTMSKEAAQRYHLATAPATDLAAAWDGYGTALKPAFEPILCARKPLIGTLAENISVHGTGALDIGSSRIATDWSERSEAWKRSGHSAKPDAEKIAAPAGNGIDCHPAGRWPANVALDEGAAAMLDVQTGRLESHGHTTPIARGVGYMGGAEGKTFAPFPSEAGGPSRFFYVAKASREERDLGCEGLPRRSAGETTLREEGSAGLNSPRAGAGRTSGARNYHPNVKPVQLTRWLAGLILPPAREGHVRRLLVPYAGSGSEMCGALLAGWDLVEGIEREPRPGIPNSPDYQSILRARVQLALTNPRAFEPHAERKAEKALPGQRSLFGDIA